METSTNRSCENGRLEGSTAFTNNYAYWGGAIYNSKEENLTFPVKKWSYQAPIIKYPEDTEFSGNRGEVRQDRMDVCRESHHQFGLRCS